MYQTTACPATAPKSAIRTIFRLPHSPKDSFKGAFETVPSSFIFWNAGLSFSCNRIQTDTASSRIEKRNGTRQPHSENASGDIAVRVPMMTISDRNRPIVAVVWIQDV